MNKAILNVGNIIKGGAIQAAVNFILNEHQLCDKQYQWFYILSKEVHRELLLQQLDLTESSIVLEYSPSQNKIARKHALAFESKLSPLFVFTLFGPSYINFKQPHISGFANGWVTHSSWASFSNTYKKDWIKIAKAILKYVYYGIKIRKADAWILETNTARKGFISRLKVPEERCEIVPNTAISFGENFYKKTSVYINNIELNYQDNLVLALAADYPHKNLFRLLNTSLHLKTQLHHSNFKILFTLDHEVFDSRFLPFIVKHNLDSNIVNLGKVSIAQLPDLYSVAKVSILPSFIETFSAVYPESFATDTPVITSNEPFAQEICLDAALYIDPKEPANMASAIYRLLTDDKKYRDLVARGRLIYSNMESPKQKQENYLRTIERLLKNINH